jgi:hypothetical protein
VLDSLIKVGFSLDKSTISLITFNNALITRSKDLISPLQPPSSTEKLALFAKRGCLFAITSSLFAERQFLFAIPKTLID